MIKMMNGQMNRRSVLRTIMFTTVCAGACGIGPGRLFVSRVLAGETALFQMGFDDFPQLKQSYGSVRLRVPGIPSSKNFIVVTRMPGNQFYAVSALCTHRGVAVNPFKKGMGLFCPAHRSQFEPNGKRREGPARSSLNSFRTVYNGADAVGIEFPDLGYSVATELVEAGSGGYVKLEFETLTGMEYSVQVRDTLNDVVSVPVKFALTPNGAFNRTSIAGTGGTMQLYIEPSKDAGFVTIMRE